MPFSLLPCLSLPPASVCHSRRPGPQQIPGSVFNITRAAPPKSKGAGLGGALNTLCERVPSASSHSHTREGSAAGSRDGLKRPKACCSQPRFLLRSSLFWPPFLKKLMLTVFAIIFMEGPTSVFFLHCHFRSGKLHLHRYNVWRLVAVSHKVEEKS